LPQNCALLKSNDVKDRLNGIIFFRRVLAVDKTPPIDLIIELDCVIPALIQCLYERDAEKLQVEATWCLTNISCGESHQITHLLKHNIVDALLTVVLNTNHKGVREQAIWAMNNLSADERVCQIIGGDMAILSCLLFQVGVECFPMTSTSNASFMSPENRDFIQFGYKQRAMNDNPPLSTMRHVTFICGNLVKSKCISNLSFISCILHALADLIHSPDEEIILDICQTIAVLCTQFGDNVINLILEQGILSRLVELLDILSFQELALVAICGILRSPQSFHRKLVFHKFSSSVVSLKGNSDSSNGNNGSKRSLIMWCGHILSKTSNQLIVRDVVAGLLAIVELQSIVYSRELFSMEFYMLFEKLCKENKYEIRIEIG